jgi:arylsulfatase A-like enzyme
MDDTLIYYVWPKGIKARGEIRSQFHHVIDVAPTILEAAGLPEPTMVNGVMQEPLHGVSMVYSFDDAKAAERHETLEIGCDMGEPVSEDYGPRGNEFTGKINWV